MTHAEKEPAGLLVGGIAAGVAGSMADLLSPIYATSFHKGFGLPNTQAGFLVTAALGAMAVVEFDWRTRSAAAISRESQPGESPSPRSRCSTSARSVTTPVWPASGVSSPGCWRWAWVAD